jgi:glycosyltransferase involved in cell wall biosynthesis
MDIGHELISVIVPVYNGERYLAEAMDSVLRQCYRPIDLIVVDDGSTDRTAEVAGQYGDQIRYVYQPNGGASAARNRGIEMAAGGILCFIDADDLWSSDKLNIQLAYLAKHPSVEIVLGRTERLQLAGGSVFKKWSEPEIAMHLGPAAIKRTAFDRVGLLDSTLRFCEDWDWFMRAKELDLSFLLHEEVTYFYRRHENNMTNDTETGFSFALKMLKKSLNRRREQGNGQIHHLKKISEFTNHHSDR